MTWITSCLALTLAAMVLERASGYPEALYRRIGHPVTWMGALLTHLEARWNKGLPSPRRRAGVLTLLTLLAATALVTFPLASFGIGLGLVVIAPLASSLIAQRALAQHVQAVADGLDQSLDQGRAAVAMIVGRDVAVLDEAGVARAAIESLSENFSDGITAPVFWMAVGGLPGAALYKAINTADSMIGHKSERYIDFGRAAALTDDWVNLPASRLTAALIISAAALSPGYDARAALTALRRDARHHRSPNAGWPEAAMAGALGVSLAGPRSYGGVLIEDAEMNQGARRAVTAQDIRRALTLYWRADALLAALLATLLLTLLYLA
ncbi:MAG: adenosylcobinamide-phosphate synthase CbiB [Roseinatronobacter sp.]